MYNAEGDGENRQVQCKQDVSECDLPSTRQALTDGWQQGTEQQAMPEKIVHFFFMGFELIALKISAMKHILDMNDEESKAQHFYLQKKKLKSLKGPLHVTYIWPNKPSICPAQNDSQQS